MKKKYKVCSRLEIEGRDKAVWPNTGMTLTVKEDGKMTLFDGRTKENYFLFEIEQREKPKLQQEAASQPTGFDDLEDPGW